jgi:hypothetical protein
VAVTAWAAGGTGRSDRSGGAAAGVVDAGAAGSIGELVGRTGGAAIDSAVVRCGKVMAGVSVVGTGACRDRTN